MKNNFVDKSNNHSTIINALEIESNPQLVFSNINQSLNNSVTNHNI